VVTYQKLRSLPKLSTRTTKMFKEVNFFEQLKEVNIKIFIMKMVEREEPLVHFEFLI